MAIFDKLNKKKKGVQAPQVQIPQVAYPYYSHQPSLPTQWTMQGNDQALLGMLLGKLLRQGFDTWKDNYDARGAAKRDGGNIGDEQSGADATSIYSQPAQPQDYNFNEFRQLFPQPSQPQDFYFGNDEYTTLPSFDGLPMIGR